MALISFFTSQLTAAEADGNPRSVRQILGAVQPLEHTEAQIRAGYIDWTAEGDTVDPDNSAFAVGGHVHLDSKRWYGVMVGFEGYFVMDPGFNSDDEDKINGDFFDADKDGFATLSQAFVDGRWGHTEIKLGRQMIDTPHADSDDIRMMPNYFLAYMVSNTDIEGLTLTAGQIEQMGGWENGIDAKKFISVEKVLGAERSTNGIYVGSAVYEGIDNLTLQAWYYAMTDIANVVYLEAGYQLSTDPATFTFGLQYDTATETGDELIRRVDSNTWGISVEAGFDNIGLTLMAAYNRDSGDTGAFASLGGGPFFTSMEDQTIDTIGAKGDAFMLAAGYDFGGIVIEGLNAGIAWGHFEADESSDYETDEIDVAASYTIGEKLHLSIAYSIVDDKTYANEDYNQFRIIVNYNFST